MQRTTKENLTEVDLSENLEFYVDDEENEDRFNPVEVGNPYAGYIELEFDEALTILKERFGKMLNGWGHVVPIETIKKSK